MTIAPQAARHRQVSSPDGIAYQLTVETLRQLAAAEIGAIHVRGFYPVDVARDAAAKAIDHPALSPYHKELASSVGRVHMPYIDTKRDPELIAKYHDAALLSIDEARAMFEPYLAPIDKVRLLLSELWPGGADLLRLHGRTCFVGALRVFQPTTSEFYPHNDRLDLQSDAPEIAGLSEQLVANVYLQVPEQGGDLQLWRRYPTEAEQQVIIDVDGLDPATIEPPVITIHPEAGDLIIFSSAMLHGVSPGNGHRVGMACFVGVVTSDKPLFYWS